MPWKGGSQKLYEVSTRRCTHISTEVHEEEFGSYQTMAQKPVDTFIAWIQHILEHHRAHALDIVLIGILARWWDTSEPYREWEYLRHPCGKGSD
jgi:hypothetical protein